VTGASVCFVNERGLLARTVRFKFDATVGGGGFGGEDDDATTNGFDCTDGENDFAGAGDDGEPPLAFNACRRCNSAIIPPPLLLPPPLPPPLLPLMEGEDDDDGEVTTDLPADIEAFDEFDFTIGVLRSLTCCTFFSLAPLWMAASSELSIF
jgi:hypothetical protein